MNGATISQIPASALIAAAARASSARDEAGAAGTSDAPSARRGGAAWRTGERVGAEWVDMWPPMVGFTGMAARPPLVARAGPSSRGPLAAGGQRAPSGRDGRLAVQHP